MADQSARYQLEIRADVRQVDEHGSWRTGNALSVAETVNLGALDFLSICAVLGRLHELVDTMKAKEAAGG